MQNFDLMPEQGNAAGATVVARIAVFESKDTTQLEKTIVITHQSQASSNNGFIKKLKALFATGITGGTNTDLPCFQAIEPEPDDQCRQAEKQ